MAATLAPLAINPITGPFTAGMAWPILKQLLHGVGLGAGVEGAEALWGLMKGGSGG
jgi:hypothetical protein